MSAGTNIHIYPSDMTAESRMMKITASLRGFGYFSKILLIGIQSGGTAAHEVIDETRAIYRFPRGIGIVRGRLWRKLTATLGWSWAIWKFTRGQDIRVINCHSLPVLPLCVALKFRHRALLVYDTHELETETTESHGLRRVFAKALEHALIGFSDLTIVVGEMIAQWYAQTYRMEKPVVVWNIPELGAPLPPLAGGDGGRNAGAKIGAEQVDNAPSPQPSPASGRGGSPLRAKLGLDENAIIVLYVGKLSANRGIERLLALFSKLERPIHLVCMGDGALVAMIQAYAARHPTIHWLPPVPYAQVVAHARGADMGVSVIDHSCLSYTYAMPNKFFECLQAGVPVLIGDMPEQRAIIDRYEAGWILPDNDDAARLFIEQLTKEDIQQKRHNVAKISHLYTWERERETLHAAYEKLRVAHPGKF